MLFVKHYHILPPPYGGVSVYVKRLMLALCKKGLISSAFKGEELVGLPANVLENLDEFPQHSRSIFILPEFLKLYRVVKPYKILHAHTSLTTCFGIWMLHKTLRIPVVYTIHNQMIDRELSLLFPWDIFFLKSLASSSTVQFTTVNSLAKEKLEANGIYFKNEIKVISPYISPVEYGEPSDYLSKALLTFIEKHQRFILFYAESFATYQGVDIYGTQTIVEAFINVAKQDNDTALVFCIPNVGSMQGKLKSLVEMIEKSGCANRVFWQIGAIHEMWPLLKKATVLVRPTTTDGDSVMIREALSFGLPVITTDIALRPDGCIIYPLGDLRTLINKILYVVRHPYRKIYPQEEHTKAMLDIYQSLTVMNK